MLKAFSQIDLFGKAVLFNYKGNSTSKSKVGAICTILLFGFIIWLVVYFGQALFNKSNPQATTFESYNENPSATALTTDSFVFAIGLANSISYANFINESLYSVYASTYKTVRTPQADGSVDITYEQIQLEIVSCKSEYFGNLADQFAYLTLDQLYCIKPNQSALTGGFPVLEGSFESPSYQSVYIQFAQCDNTTSSCGTQTEIDTALRGAYMSLVYSNIAVDLTNSKAPLKQFRDSYYTTVDNHYYKEITMYIEQLEINTDDGWLTTSYETEDYIMFGEIREFLSLTPKSSFAYFSMRLSNVETHYNRSYTKLQTIIAQVNGIITVAFTVLILILAPYVRLKFYETLINEIFDIKISKGKSKAKNTKKKTAKAAKKQHLKGNEPKDQPKSLEKNSSFNEDLEQQRSKSKPKNEVMTNTPELTDRKDKGELDLDIKRGSSLEESVQGNNSVLMPISSIPSPGSESIRKREKLNYSRFRGVFPPNGLTISIQSDTGPINQELSPIESPIDSPDITRREGLMKDRKPSFLQPNFKSLDFEDHAEDFEDILKNIQQGQQDNKEELVISGIRSENDDQKTLARTTTTRGIKNTWTPETVRSNNNEEEEEQQMDEKGNEFDISRKQRLQRIDSTLSKLSGGVNLSFGEYLRSVFSRSDVIKEKMRILNEGINRINERLDIFNLFKKLREFDKLKVLLLEDEQFVLFDSLPRPELTVKSDDTPQNSASQNLIKDAQFIKDKRKKEMILLSYERLKRKTAPTMIDKKLFDIYDNRLSMFLQ